MRPPFGAELLLVATFMANCAICSVATASPIDQNMPKESEPPRNLIPGVFALEQPVGEVEKQLLDEGYKLMSTRTITILLDRHVPSYKDGGMFDFGALGASGPKGLGKALDFKKSGPQFCSGVYEVQLGATDDGKLQFAQALRPSNSCVL